MKYLAFTLFLSFVIISCISNRYIKGTPFKNTLLYENQDSVSFYRGHKVALWKPTKQELKLAEKLMQDYIIKNKLLKSLESYTRQYIGIIENGKKIVKIEGFCVPPTLFKHDQNWKKYLVRVDDGGDCFFGIKVNLNTKECYSFGVNSEA